MRIVSLFSLVFPNFLYIEFKEERLGWWEIKKAGGNMKIEKIDIDKIIEYSGNVKEHPEWQIEQIKNSIKEFGFNDPIAIDENGIIIEGHGRLIALKELGYKEVECIRLEHLTEEQKVAYAIVHNKLTMNTDFDIEMLKYEINKLELADFDLDILGFDEVELEEILFEDIENDTEDTEMIDKKDEIDEDVEIKIKKGQIWKLGNHYLMCGDSTKKDNFEKLLKDIDINLCLTDPPYGINIVKNGKIGAENAAKTTEYKKVKGDETTETAQKSFELIKQYSEKVILFGGNYFTAFLPFSDGWIVWDKRKDMNSNNFADGELAWCNFHTPVRIYKQLWNGMIREGERGKRVHPTQKPIRMLGEILQDFSKENDNILDVFGGSGSTLIACEETGRNCYMIEYEEHYCNVILKRWEDLTGEQGILYKK